jgi:hypothetical protein
MTKAFALCGGEWTLLLQGLLILDFLSDIFKPFPQHGDDAPKKQMQRK